VNSGHDHAMVPDPAYPSLMDRLDARARLVSIVIWTGVSAWLSDPLALSIALVTAVIMTPAVSINAAHLFSRLGSLTLALIPAWIVLPLIGMGGEELRAGPLHISSSGLLFASLLQARACTIVAVVILHQGHTPWNRWVWAAGKLGVPASLLNLMTITLRYLPILSEESQRTTTAARARGFEASAGNRGYTVLASIIGAGAARSYYRSERLYRAMVSRGYEGRFYPLMINEVNYMDYLFIVLSAIMVLAIVLLARGVIG